MSSSCYFSDIEPCRSIALQLAAVLLVAKVLDCMNFLEMRRYVQNEHKLLNVIGVVPQQDSKHFEQDCFILESVCYHKDVGIPAKKQLKPNAIHTRFTRPTHSRSTPPCKRTTYGKHQQQTVSVNMLVIILK